MSAEGVPPVLDRPVAVGRTAEVFRLDDGRVLKLFLPGVPGHEIRTEEANCAVAVALGATPIRCHGTMTVGDRTGLVFDPVSGDSLTRVAEKNLLRLRAVGRRLAHVHVGVHGHTSDHFPDVREAAVSQLASPGLADLTARERARARELILALPAGSTVLHMDFHSQNVFEHRGAHAVIDWQTTLRGAAAADVASTRFLLAEAELWPGISALRHALYSTVRRIMLGAYLAEYLRVTGMTRAEVDRWRLPILVLRLGQWDIASERAALLAEVRVLVR
ncbi:aminoglycoside phosphotransferase family protein [Cellulomonas hominis]